MITEFVIGITTLLIGTVIIYSFRSRQLYLVIPKLFGHSNISDDGKVAELTIINRGRLTEEDLRVELNPSLQYEILAASASSITLGSSVLMLQRLSGRDEVSVVLLVEKGSFSKSDISSISSKEKKGKIIEKLEDVPPNTGNVILLSVAVLLFCIGVFKASYIHSVYSQYKIDYYLEEQVAEGWYDLDMYVTSDYIDFYGEDRFPIKQISAERKKNKFNASFEVSNLTDSFLSVTAHIGLVDEKDKPRVWQKPKRFNSTGDIGIGGKGDVEVIIEIPKDYDKEWVVVEFTLKSVDEFVYKLKKRVLIGG
ncbi:MAG: hypothetical protein QM504_16685 [Pseudomonadota bacterium]